MIARRLYVACVSLLAAACPRNEAGPTIGQTAAARGDAAPPSATAAATTSAPAASSPASSSHAIPPPPPPSPGRSFTRAERACVRDADCAVVPPPKCACAQCGRAWISVGNKGTVDRIVREMKRDEPAACPPVFCAPCPPIAPYAPGTEPVAPGLVGNRAACVAGQCTACQNAECAPP